MPSVRLVARLLPLVALLLIRTSAHAQYTYTRIADTSGVYASFGGASINLSGQVAFTASLSAGGSGVYRANRGAAPTLLGGSGTDFTSLAGPTIINAVGQVAFVGSTATTQYLYRADGTTLTKLADTVGTYTTQFTDTTVTFKALEPNPSLNGRGQGAFTATAEVTRTNSATNTQVKTIEPGVYLSGTSTNATTLLTSGTTYSQYTAYSDPSLNARGNAAFYATRVGGQDLLVAGGGGTPLTYATTGSTYSGFTTGPALNAFGTAVFGAPLTSGGSGIFLGSADRASSALATTANGYNSFGFAAINGSEMVVFQASAVINGNLLNGIYTGADPTTSKVIAAGDTLDGSTVTNVSFNRDGLNDSGVVTFLATLADGRQGVYTASAMTVPEPSPLLLLVLPVMGLLGWRFRRLAPITLLLMLGLLPGTARAQTLFIASGDNGDRFGTLNVLTGQYTPIGTLANGVYGLAAVSATEFYAVGNTIDATLYQLDPTTGVQTAIGNLGAGNEAYGLAYRNGVLYGINPSTVNNLLQIDPVTGAIAESREVGFDGDGTLGVGPDGNLYATQGTFGTGFYRLNAATGASTLLSADPGYGVVLGLGTVNGTLYALNQSGGIFRLDLATGTAESTGATYDVASVGPVLAATSLPAINAVAAPEPASVLLLAPGIALVRLKRRRRSSLARA